MDNIFNRGVLVSLKTSIWGGRVKLPSSVIEGADPDFITASKYLVDRDCLKPIEQIRNAARSYLYEKSLPFPIDGVLFIPKDMIEPVDNKLKGLQTAFNEQVGEFEGMYSTFQLQAKEKLKELYNPADYPQDISRKFGFEWRFFVMDTPDSTSLISPELYAREKEKFQQTMVEFQETAIQALRSTFTEMVDRIVDNLKNNKKFKDSSIDKFKEFLADFNKLNIADDTELAGLIEKCQGIITGSVNPQAIRDDEVLRKHIADSIGEVRNMMIDNLVTRPTRKLKVA